MTDFMMDLHDDLMKKRRVVERTVVAYLRNLVILNDREAFDNLAFLRNIPAIMRKMEKYALSTKKNLLATIASVLSIQTAPAYKKLYEDYSVKLKEAHGLIDKERGDTMTQTEKEKEGWVEWKDVLAKLEDLKDQAKDARDDAKRPKAPSNAKSKALLKAQDYLVLALYTYLPPRRNMDYQDMKVVLGGLTKDSPKNVNYLDMFKNQFVFNRYKTAGATGQQIVDIPEELMEVIKEYLRVHPKDIDDDGEFWFLITATGRKIPANGITRILNRIFKKKVGASMLRHIYLSHKYGSTVKDMKKDAAAMAHSEKVQKTYIRDTGKD